VQFVLLVSLPYFYNASATEFVMMLIFAFELFTVCVLSTGYADLLHN